CCVHFVRLYFFFFQAEDGIRDFHVTGVQTCALPISGPPTAVGYPSSYLEWHTNLAGSYIAHVISLITEGVFVTFPDLKFVLVEEIGRASCRERVESRVLGWRVVCRCRRVD